MFISPVVANANSNTPKEYTNRARDEINRKLNLNSSSATLTSSASTLLRHGPSPLQRVTTTSSDISLTRTASNDSIETATSNVTISSKKSFFGRLRHRKNTNDVDTEMSDLDSVQESLQESVPSAYSMRSNNDSLFSTPNTLNTTFTNISNNTTTTPNYQAFTTPSLQPKPTLLTLQQSLPSNFSDMYSPELMADPRLLIDGRPMFTKRALQDWELNDIRSLLIVESLRPEWNGMLPIIFSPQGFKFVYLPLDADDDTVVQTLVHSDIYKEAKLDMAFRVQTAKYTLGAARQRHEQILRASGMSSLGSRRYLSKPEWRNVIENFLLNLAVESQCRADFKRVCHDLKKYKRGSTQPRRGSLLKKAIMNDIDVQHNANASQVKLSKEEKAHLWSDVQQKVYKRIGLDWQPDVVS